MPNLNDWKPVRRNTSRYLADLEAWVNEFVPRSVHGPSLVTPDDPRLWEAALAIAKQMVESVARSNRMAWRTFVTRGTPLWISRRIFAGLRNEMATVVGQRVSDGSGGAQHRRSSTDKEA